MKDSPTEKYLLDTNVLKVADESFLREQSPKKREEARNQISCCIARCVEYVENIPKKGSLVLDKEKQIFNEYLRHLPPKRHIRFKSSKELITSKFLQWVILNHKNEKSVSLVEITKKGGDYVEFDSQSALKGFDSDDWKFLVAAKVHPDNPTILEATDKEWWERRDDLEKAGINVRFLCEEYISKPRLPSPKTKRRMAKKKGRSGGKSSG